MAKPKILEKDIQKTILDYLAIKGVFCWRNNTGAFRDSTDHFYRFGALGSPDIICIHKGKFLGIEVKAEGGKLSKHQQEFGQRIQRAGGDYIVARSLDDVAAWFCA